MKTGLKQDKLTSSIITLLCIQVTMKLFQWTCLSKIFDCLVECSKKCGKFMDDEEEAMELFKRGTLTDQ